MWKLLQRNVERILCGSFNDSSISLVWFNNYSKKYIYISFDLNNFSINKISRFITTCRYLFVVLYIYISRSSHHRMLQMHLTSMQCFFPGVFPFFGPKFSCVFDVAFFFNFFFPFFFFFSLISQTVTHRAQRLLLAPWKFPFAKTSGVACRVLARRVWRAFSPSSSSPVFRHRYRWEITLSEYKYTDFKLIDDRQKFHDNFYFSLKNTG